MIKIKILKKLILNTFNSNSITSNLKIDQTSLDYFLHLIQDLDISKDEKIETIRGILELQSDSTSISLSNEPNNDLSLDECIEKVLQISSNYLQDPTQFEEEEEEEEEEPNLLNKPCTKIKKDSTSINSNELQKKSIIATYGKVEDQTDDLNQITKLTPKQIQELKDKETLMLEEQLKLLGLKSKSRKKAESKLIGDPLLRPNLNSALVDYETKLKREESANKAKAKSEKHKADLTKQRETQAKKKADARARASKGERKA